MELFVEIEKSFSKIEELFLHDEIKEFRDTPTAHLCLYHFGLGTWIRNNLLACDSTLYGLFIANQISSKDDMSFLMIERFHRYASEKHEQRQSGAG